MEKNRNGNRSRGAESAPPDALLVVSSAEAARRYACMALLAYSQTGPEDPRRAPLLAMQVALSGALPAVVPLPSAGFLPSVGLLAARALARLVEVDEGVVLGGTSSGTSSGSPTPWASARRGAGPPDHFRGATKMIPARIPRRSPANLSASRA